MQIIGLYVQAFAVSISVAGIGSVPTPEPLVSLSVRGDAYYSKPHSIDIHIDVPGGRQGLQDGEARRWRAIRTSDGRVDVIVSEECPALGSVASEFEAFASEGPSASRLTPNTKTLPIPPTLKDGFSTIVSYPTPRQDGSMAFIYRSGGAWGHRVVSTLLPCWGPLIPPPPQGLSAARLLQGLDLSSLPNSTEPSGAKSFNRPEDWGFTQFRNDGDVATLERPDSRAISLKIVRWTPDGYIACFYDRHLTYDTHATLRLVNDGRAGFKVAERLAPDLACLEPPKQEGRDNSN